VRHLVGSDEYEAVAGVERPGVRPHQSGLYVSPALDPQQHGPAVVELHGRRRRLGPGGELDGTEVDLGGQSS